MQRFRDIKNNIHQALKAVPNNLLRKNILINDNIIGGTTFNKFKQPLNIFIKVKLIQSQFILLEGNKFGRLSQITLDIENEYLVINKLFVDHFFMFIT